MKIIDSHVHLGLNQFRITEEIKSTYNLENKFEDYWAKFSKADLSAACVLPIPGDDFDTEKSNEYLLNAKERSHGKFIPICRVDDKLGYNLNNGFAGAKIHRVYEEYTNNEFNEYLEFLQLYDRPLIIHAKFKDKVGQILKIVRIAPHLKIILAHMGRGHLYTSEGVIENAIALRRFENVFFETSTVGNSETIAKTCSIIGSQRIMFGSDYPFGKIYLSKGYNYLDEFEVINNANISIKQKEDIFYNTAYEVFHIGKLETNNHVYISKYNHSYKKQLMDIIEDLSDEDKAFLALSHKTNIIRLCINKEKHIYLIFKGNHVVGFFRESGRPQGYTMLEEIALLPACRGQGIGIKTMQLIKSLFPFCLVKTNAKNVIMNSILLKMGFLKNEGIRISDWVYKAH